MNAIIQQKLREIEEKEHIRIIHCVESGSRAWGFASPDSDYDVRFIYVRRPEEYLRLDKSRDVIEWQLDDILDINGWDLQKALRLLYKSNPTLFEWNNSPVVYRTTDDWKQIGDMIEKFFVAKSSLYHYLSMAKSNYREYLHGEQVRLKKYFYVLRPILACRWILEKKTPPPMLFSQLMEACLPPELLADVERLLDLKIHAPEKEYGARVDSINKYIENSFEEISEILSTMPTDRNTDWAALNKVFLSQVAATK